jgi:hypothetical protein
VSLYQHQEIANIDSIEAGKIYLKSFIFHLVQLFTILFVFGKQFEKTEMLLALRFFIAGLTIFLLQYFYHKLVLHGRFHNSSVKLNCHLYFFFTLLPIIYIFIVEFVIGTMEFDEKSYNAKKAIYQKLKSHGSLSNEEFDSKIGELEILKIKTEISLSIEYQKLKRHLKKRNITQRDIDNYVIKEIQKRTVIDS